MQQLQFLRLSQNLASYGLDVLLVHAGVLRHPSTIGVLLRASSRLKTSMVLDVRDVAFPASRSQMLEKFDGVIACAEAPRRHIAALSNGHVDPFVVPVIFEHEPPTSSDRHDADVALAEAGISRDDRFVMMNGGLTPMKGARDAAEVALALQPFGIPLVSCGPVRDSDPTITSARDAGALRWLGRVPHGVHTAVLERAGCIASFSKMEGLPRTFLEALTMRKVLFAPTVVPEFSALPQLSGSPAEKAAQIVAALEHDTADHGSAYSLEQHAPEVVLDLLVSHLRKVGETT